MKVYIERKEWSSEVDSKENPAPYLNLTEETLIDTIYFNNVWYMEAENLEDVLEEIRSHGEGFTWENTSGESVVRVTIG
ncbi:hypothetical protein [Bacillus cereus]|uniref:Uncharacterized protein n=1 Tax=Bacillus cereus VD184 TaxID=1053242 RepID=A0A9W5R048_BACCE|nr:hypothetical protein [Bacillus cereus]EOQ00942.1 hypothetical protein IKC_06140 [Bacillus cereus VD184]